MKKTLIEVLVQYSDWTYTHEWWFPISSIVLGVTILLCLILMETWPVIAAMGTAVFLFMWAIPMWVEYMLDENNQPSEMVSKLLTWANVIVVLMSLLFIDIFVALAHNPPRIGHALFCAVLFLAGICLLWFECRKNQKKR